MQSFQIFQQRTYVRAMFISFSSVLNTIKPHLMLRKLMDKNVHSNLIIYGSTNVSLLEGEGGGGGGGVFNDSFSNCTTINTGAPQGCVLSASLFTIYESDNVPENENCVRPIMKYADNTGIVGLLAENDDHIENFYTSEIDRFNYWCKVNIYVCTYVCILMAMLFATQISCT